MTITTARSRVARMLANAIHTIWVDVREEPVGCTKLMLEMLAPPMESQGGRSPVPQTSGFRDMLQEGEGDKGGYNHEGMWFALA